MDKTWGQGHVGLPEQGVGGVVAHLLEEAERRIDVLDREARGIGDGLGPGVGGRDSVMARATRRSRGRGDAGGARHEVEDYQKNETPITTN